MTRFLGLLTLATAALADYGSNWQQRNYDTIRAIYNISIYPHNQGFMSEGAKAIPAGLFAENATGRIQPMGNFTGFIESTEYFFGLAPPPMAPNYATWTSAKLVAFSSSCPEVAATDGYASTTGVNASHPETYGKTITMLKQTAFWRFDETGAVVAYDAILPSLHDYTDILYGIAPNGPVPRREHQAAMIENICTAQNVLCVDKNKQYNSTDACVTHLYEIPYGNFDEAWGNDVVCRSYHVLLAKLRPDVSNLHCRSQYKYSVLTATCRSTAYMLALQEALPVLMLPTMMSILTTRHCLGLQPAIPLPALV